MEDILDASVPEEAINKKLTGPLLLRPWPLFFMEFVFILLFIASMFLSTGRGSYNFPVWIISIVLFNLFYWFTALKKAANPEFNWLSYCVINGVILYFSIFGYLANIYAFTFEFFGFYLFLGIGYVIIAHLLVAIVAFLRNKEKREQFFPLFLIPITILAIFSEPILNNISASISYLMDPYLIYISFSISLFTTGFLIYSMIRNWQKYRYLLYYLNRVLLLLIIMSVALYFHLERL